MSAWRSVQYVFQFVVVLLSKPRCLDPFRAQSPVQTSQSPRRRFPYACFFSLLGGGLWFDFGTWKRNETLLFFPEPVHDNEQLAGDRDDGTFLRVLTTANR
jgi:hypothetical protein